VCVHCLFPPSLSPSFSVSLSLYLYLSLSLSLSLFVYAFVWFYLCPRVCVCVFLVWYLYLLMRLANLNCEWKWKCQWRSKSDAEIVLGPCIWSVCVYWAGVINFVKLWIIYLAQRLAMVAATSSICNFKCAESSVHLKRRPIPMHPGANVNIHPVEPYDFLESFPITDFDKCMNCLPKPHWSTRSQFGFCWIIPSSFCGDHTMIISAFDWYLTLPSGYWFGMCCAGTPCPTRRRSKIQHVQISTQKFMKQLGLF
jgi:hypothetical protein